MKLLAKGAEANVYEDNGVIIKERISKSYRIPEIDKKLILLRLKRESKILKKLNELKINAPKFIKTVGNKLYIEKIDAVPVKDVLNSENHKEILASIGELVATIHNENIIHGDLTTLNFLINSKGVYVIDFGLSSISHKDEDKAVDLYVFERAVKCAHSEEFLEGFYEGYSRKGQESVLKRLEQVRLRGRKREELSG